jgi:WhiB family transcriptional regulator, redox-sensing transcriptional regulator
MAPEVPDPALLADSMLSRPNWQSQGACGDSEPNVFFPERGASVLPALAICGNCAVSSECLSYAMERSHLVGIWGGTSERQRRLLRRQSA